MAEPTPDTATAAPASADAAPAGGSTLLTGTEAPAGEQNGNTDASRAPDKGPGENAPDKGPGEKTPDQSAQADAAQADAPIEYTDFTAPEGVQLNADLLTAFKEKAAAHKLSQEDAQAYVDLGARILQDQAKAQADAIIAVRTDWATTSQAEFPPEKLAQARRAVDTYGDAELRSFLDTTGVGNHPAVIRLLTKAGASLAEDKFVGGGSAPTKAATLAERLYPSTNAA